MRASIIDRAAVHAHTRDPWPMPAGGHTRRRWTQLTALGERDLPLAKLVEPHHDALAILNDLEPQRPPAGADDIWAVWAAAPPFAVLQAERGGDGWTLTGRKAFCSGASIVTHALVTASAPDGMRLFSIDLAAGGITAVPEDHAWEAAGMARAATVTLAFDDVSACAVGGPGEYVGRAGFWWGAIGIAAIWFGGARAVGQVLECARERLDPHGLAHLGGVRAELDSLAMVLESAARAADHDRLAIGDVERLALVVRQRASEVVDSVLRHVDRALGPAPLAFDAEHVARVDDLRLFVRQHHAERDLEHLGSLDSAHAH